MSSASTAARTRHVAFFNRSYAPDETATARLLSELCEDLVARHGWRVSVITGVAPGAAPGRSTVRGVQVVRVAGTQWAKGRIVGRAANYLTYFASAWLAGYRLNRPDVIVALTDPPVIGLAAWRVSRRFGVPLVMAFNDIFPEVAALLPGFRSRLVDAALTRVNRLLVRRAAVNVALGETMKRRLIEGKGALAERVVVIPSWADTSLIVPGAKDNPFARRHALAGKFVIMHSGNLGLSQELDAFISTAAALREHDDIVFVLQGDGVRKAELEQQVEAQQLRNVRFLPFAPASELADSFATADVFVVSLRRGLAGYIVPSKLYGVLAAGRPYVAAVEDDSEVATLTRLHGTGVVIPPADAAAMAAAILSWQGDAPRRAASGAAARALALQFDRRVQVDRYAALLDGCAPR